MCTTQDGNTEKCLRTIKTCEPGEDYCLTTIAWGSKYPYYGLKTFEKKKNTHNRDEK